MPRINDERLAKLIKDEGTADGINTINNTGIVRLCLDLQDARKECKKLKKELSEYVDFDHGQKKRLRDA
jgi:hypothetical protein